MRAIASAAGLRQFRGVFLLLGLMAIVFTLSNWIITGSTQGLVVGGMAIALVVIVVNTLNDWRAGLFLFILWLLFEDLARKFMGNGLIFFFGKDLLAAITYASFLKAKAKGEVSWFKPPFLVPLALFFGLALIQVFNTASPSIIYGLLGLKLYFYYVPLMFNAYFWLLIGILFRLPHLAKTRTVVPAPASAAVPLRIGSRPLPAFARGR